jgi:hypothetical protein
MDVTLDGDHLAAVDRLERDMAEVLRGKPGLLPLAALAAARDLRVMFGEKGHELLVVVPDVVLESRASDG